MVPITLGGIFVTLLQVFSTAKCYHYNCSRADYYKCVRIADPLVRDLHLVFPDNLEDIDAVCRTWNNFIDCLRMYTNRCFTPAQREQFNNAVKNPIESVHQMCLRSDYQREYLIYAPCIKSTITDIKHCAIQYNLLVDQVAQGDDISRTTLCCSHDRFKKCIQSETRSLCDNGRADGPAFRFSSQIVEKALSFLQDECFNYIPNSGDCSIDGSKRDDQPIDSVIAQSSSEVYPWSTIQDAANRDQPPVNKQPPKTTMTWLPSSTYYHPSSDSDPSVSEVLGARTRPSSYARSNGWTDYSNHNTQPGINNMFSEVLTTPKPEWATISTWHVLNQQPSSLGTSSSNDQNIRDFSNGKPSQFDISSTETWFPVAGNQMENEVDEPNQQGLIKPKNGGAKIANLNRTCPLLIALLVLRFC